MAINTDLCKDKFFFLPTILPVKQIRAFNYIKYRACKVRDTYTLVVVSHKGQILRTVAQDLANPEAVAKVIEFKIQEHLRPV